MNLSAPANASTDRMGRIILLGMEEIIGSIEFDAVINQAARSEGLEPDLPNTRKLDFSFEMLPQLQACLEQAYGLPAGRGLAIRSGRACFRHILREFGAEMGLTGLEYRLLSLPNRIKVSALALAELFNRHTGLHVDFGMDDDHIHWIIQGEPVNGGKCNGKSTCHLTFGLLQEALAWSSGGKIYRMEETRCTARGDPCCTIQVWKNPIS
jgi:predicted hydrocarbon binding protein